MLAQPDLFHPERPRQERRVWVRRCPVGACEAKASARTGASDVFELAVVRDISCCGIGLVLSSRVLPGAILDLEFRGVDFPRSVIAWVVYVANQADGTRLAGCRFISPLGENELDLLLHG